MRCTSVSLLVFCLCAGIHAQTTSPQTATAQTQPAAAVSFDFAFPGATPPHYSIAVESNGHASYRSDNAASDPYVKEFIISKSTCTRIFQLAREAKYFKGDFNYSKGHIASMGSKTLTYTEPVAGQSGMPGGGVRNQTVYNYSENRPIQQLTTVFQSLSNTVELGQRLQFHHRFDKLGLDAELKAAEDMAQSGQLLELQIIAPVLQDVAEDTSVLNIARERARRLLKSASEPNP